MRKLFSKTILGSIFIIPLSMSATGSNTPLWLRYPAISPDGQTIVFSYKGDLFTVSANGGEARQLTSNPAYDAYPVWSPDGSKIAYASDRDGSLDVFVIPAKGGTSQRLTTNSVSEIPSAWLDDNTVIFSASLQPDRQAAQGQFQTAAYTVTLDGKRPKMFKSLAMPAIDVDKSGKKILYHDKKGFENEYRKHERSAGTSDIWLIDDGEFVRLTDFNGHDLNPHWNSKETDIFFVSERDGTLNVWQMDIKGENLRQLSFFEKHPVRNLSVSDNDRLAFAWNGEIYTLTPGKEPQKVAVTITTDDYDADLKKNFRSSGASNMTVSPDGEQVAFVLRGDIYVTSTKYKTTKRITNTPFQERVLAFSPDGRSLVYDSDREGQWKLYIAKIDKDDEKTFPYSTAITESVLYAPADGKAAQQPAFSPDGKKVAFLENRTELKVIDIDSKNVHTALDGKYNYSYSDGDVEFVWSPDSRWFLTSFIGDGGWNNQDIALVSADGNTVVDLTESGYSNSNPKWALDGNAITFATSKYGMRSHGSWGEQDDVMIMFLEGDAWDEFRQTEEEAEIAKQKKEESEKDKKDSEENKDKKDKKSKKEAEKTDEVKPLEFDLPNRKYRVARLTGRSSNMGDYFLSRKGDKLYYVAAAAEGGSNLLERDLKKGSTKVLVKGLSGGFEADKKGENLYAMTSNGMSKISLSDGSEKPIEFEALYERHPSAEREYIYDHMLSQVRDKFYDEKLHGVDWEMYGENYRRFLPYINNNYDFADLLSEILGELNASHTGGRYSGSGAALSSANLGAFFDFDYEGDGLKITEVLPRGPLASKSVAAMPGDIITSIDGVTILPETDVNLILEGKAGKAVLVEIMRTDGVKDIVTVKPISQGTLKQQLYQRWVERNEAVVDSLSGGRLAYVHVQGMDSPSFREVYSNLLGKYRNREAVIVDTRYNGGGWLHNDIALLLNGKEYVRYNPRGHYIGSDPFSQWTKPSVMLVNESNYSDAHGTPYVYQTLGIGDIVGSPVPGTMTAVWWETQIDPSIVFGIPQVTSLDRSGQPLENKQLTPDYIIYNNPGDVLRGEDSQLAGAVKILLEKLDNKK